jgi:hypothetical protein
VPERALKPLSPKRQPASSMIRPSSFVIPTSTYVVLYLSIELLLIAFHINTALELSTSSSQFESRVTVFDRFVQFVEALFSAVLKRMLQTGSQVWHELGYRSRFVSGSTVCDVLIDLPSVCNGTGNALSN